ncbi:hypothetical protein Droror1_Dr00017411 [Drosera rotundifolia]
MGWPWNNEAEGCLLGIRLSFLGCGSFSVGLCASHKISDVSSLVSFLTHWANTTRDHQLGAIDQTNNKIHLSRVPVISVYPDFCDDQEVAIPERPFTKMSNIVTKRFVFTPTKLDLLRDITSTSRVPNPTRVEVVTSIIFRCAIKASRVASLEQGTKSKLSMMSQTVNLHRWMDQQGTNSNVLGNAVWFFRVAADHDDEKELDLERLVVEMRKGIEGVRDESKLMKGTKLVSMIRNMSVSSPEQVYD